VLRFLIIGSSTVSTEHNLSYAFISFKHKDINTIYNDDSKFARQLKKLMKDEEEDKKIQKLVDLSTYLDQIENIKVKSLNNHLANFFLTAILSFIQVYSQTWQTIIKHFTQIIK
jgi:hypothetical protein